MKKILIIMTLFSHSALSDSLPAIYWHTSINARYSFSISVPSHFTPDPSPDNGDGHSLRYKDIYLAYFGKNNMYIDASNPLAAEQQWNIDLLEATKSTITYQVIKKDFFVISGITANEYIYYVKTIYSSANNTFITFIAKYPKQDADKSGIEPIIITMAKSLKFIH